MEIHEQDSKEWLHAIYKRNWIKQTIWSISSHFSPQLSIDLASLLPFHSSHSFLHLSPLQGHLLAIEALFDEVFIFLLIFFFFTPVSLCVSIILYHVAPFSLFKPSLHLFIIISYFLALLFIFLPYSLLFSLLHIAFLYIFIL